VLSIRVKNSAWSKELQGPKSEHSTHPIDHFNPVDVGCVEPGRCVDEVQLPLTD
jgi:hypothetical protein